jgi:hypothetical protein
MGTTNSINDGVVSLENAFFLLRPVDFHSKEIDENSYIMLEAPFATHDLNTDSIKTDHGKIRMFGLKDGRNHFCQSIHFLKNENVREWK